MTAASQRSFLPMTAAKKKKTVCTPACNASSMRHARCGNEGIRFTVSVAFMVHEPDD